MSIKVTEIELTDPNLSFAGIDPTQFSSIQCLVRVNGVPIGYSWFRLEAGLPIPDPTTIRLEIVQQLQYQLFQIITKSSLAALANPSGVKTHSSNVTTSINSSLPPLISSLPTITVAVVTRNRAASLERALKTLVKLEYPADKLEILIIDNAPNNDDAKLVVAKFPTFRYEVETRPGLEWGRNRAIVEANGEIIVYTDDDVEVDSKWVLAIGRCFAVNPEAMSVTGLVIAASRENEFQNIFEEFGGFSKGFQIRQYAMPLQRYVPFFPLGAGSFGAGANMAFRKKVLQQIGGFDPALGSGSIASGAGDIDMLYRIVRAGHLVIYEPSAILKHHHRSDYAGLKKQLQGGLFAVFTKIIWEDKPFRWKAVSFGLWWFYKNHLLRALTAKEPIRRKLLWARVWNALRSPLKYFRSVRRKKEMLAQYGNIELNKER